MKIYINIPQDTKIWFFNMYNLFFNSLKDLGYQLTDIQSSDVVIAIQHFPDYIKKEEGKKYILLQVEQRNHPTVNVEGYYKFADKIWSYDIDNKKEEYIVLGYHPCLEIKGQVQKNINVGFFGCSTERRNTFFNKILYKPIGISTWDYNIKINNIKKTKINLNYHSYAACSYTEWDRISLILANRSFLLSENFYCPLKINQFSNEKEYNDNVKYFLNHEKEREDIANRLYEEYKTKYDMRKILEEKLSKI
jgi:hypothetical protein